MSWRPGPLNHFFTQNNPFTSEQLAHMDVYQFGVFTGGSMMEIAELIGKHRFPINTFWGFDVFTGMPKELAEPIYQDDWDPDKTPDAFNAVLKTGSTDAKQVADTIQYNVQNMLNFLMSPTQAKIVAGLVEQTLPAQTDLKPAFYVDFDMDIYSPTLAAFDHLMANKLIVPGTLIGYDDWGGTPDYETFGNGESRAHKEIVDKYGLGITKIYQEGPGFPHVQTIWQVDRV
jgi:hypothetical protein